MHSPRPLQARGRHLLLALAVVSAACEDVTHPARPDRSPAFSTAGDGLAQTISGCNGAAPLRTIQANPSNYRSYIAGLEPGDRLLLAAGTYTQGLPLWGKNGAPGKCIVVEGPATGSPALFTGSDSWNVVSLKDASYIAVRNLSLDGQGKAGDGVKAEATGVSVHHILIEGLTLTNFNATQVTGINTKTPAWNWAVRRNTITNTYTGMYFGGSEGEFETANFLVEHNLVYGTMGYNVQFKHQLSRNTSLGVPASGTTIIRHNTFSKETGSIAGGFERPNLLVGHWPLSGAGSTDIYQIYGNVLYQNPYEALFQGTGNVSFHDNLLVNRSGPAVRIQYHNAAPRRVDIFNNTVVATATGISVSGGEAGYVQRVVGNAVFAGTPISGGQQASNVTGTYSAASTYLNAPMAALGSGLDLYPKTGQLQGAAIDYSPFTGLTDRDVDFNGRARNAAYRGAYSGDGANPGWAPALAIKPEPTGSAPAPGVLQNGVPVTGLSGAQGSEQFWTITVPAGATNLQFQTSGGTGDADLFVRFGAAPTLATYDCGPVTSDNNESCSFAAPSAGTWHVMVQGYAAYSGAALVASYQLCNSVAETEPNGSSNPQVITGNCNQISGTFVNETAPNDYFRVSVPAGRTVTALLNGLTVDYDVYLLDATLTQLAASENGGATADQASWTNTGSSAVDVVVRVYRYSSTGATYQLRVSY
ncbi:MAG: pre-peptidase C-terminal domain-containing protein [Gemmatimonadetes bacterium]|nr:pre-peptidase C-terminal domain-containing protein [Gemmatimonadota bacterium]